MAELWAEDIRSYFKDFDERTGSYRMRTKDFPLRIAPLKYFDEREAPMMDLCGKLRNIKVPALVIVLLSIMPSYHLAKVHARFRGHRAAMDKAGRDLFNYLIFELAGRREETLVHHANHNEAMMNIIVEMELRLSELEARMKNDD